MKKNRLIIQGIILINSTRTKKDDVISIDGENVATFLPLAYFPAHNPGRVLGIILPGSFFNPKTHTMI